MEKEHELVTSRREREDAEKDNLLKMLHSDIERLNTERWGELTEWTCEGNLNKEVFSLDKGCSDDVLHMDCASQL